MLWVYDHYKYGYVYPYSAGFDFNPFEPEFTIVISIHYKSRIAVAILDL